MGQEAQRQHLFVKAENALNGNLYRGESWDRMKSFLNLPNQAGDYYGLTLLRMSDEVNNDVARVYDPGGKSGSRKKMGRET